jgi:hypothetical protein
MQTELRVHDVGWEVFDPHEVGVSHAFRLAHAQSESCVESVWGTQMWNERAQTLLNDSAMKIFLTIASIGLVLLAMTMAIEVESENAGDQTKVEDEAAEASENKVRFHKSYRSPLEESVRLRRILAKSTSFDPIVND